MNRGSSLREGGEQVNMAEYVPVFKGGARAEEFDRRKSKGRSEGVDMTYNATTRIKVYKYERKETKILTDV